MTVLHIVLKFQVNRACFQAGEVNADFGEKVEEEERKKTKDKIEHPSWQQCHNKIV